MGSPERVWRISLPNENHEGWGIAVIDSNGYFAVCSDYGSYAHHWPNGQWGGGDFLDFFTTLGWDYVLGKVSRRSYLDKDRTIESIKDHILRYRRDGVYSKEFAKEEWDLIKEAERDGFDQREQIHWHDHTNISDAAEFFCHDYPPDAKAFAQRLLPRLQAAIREGRYETYRKEG